ncbi:hypothetical protein MRY87_10340 [bacterium]|nr:hypothetical protein [bacterium]
MLEPINAFLKRRFPRFQRLLRDRYFEPVERLNVELKMVRSGGLQKLLSRFLSGGSAWRSELPVQSPQLIDFSDLFPQEAGRDLAAFLKEQATTFSEGAHAVYFPPKSVKHPAVESFLAGYPPHCGFKLVKRSGGVYESYLSGENQSATHEALTPTPQEQILVAQVLAAHQLGPQLVDLVEFQVGAQRWAVFVVEHLSGRAPTEQEYQEGMDMLRELVRQRVLQTVVAGGFNHKDFQPPDCSQNAILCDGKFSFVDFQSFAVDNYRSYLEQLAREAVEATHFGNESIFRGGKYLYQEIPGTSLLSKRTRGAREEELLRMLGEAGIKLSGRPIFDIGCNVGMMIGLYLKHGAKWCHGWDLEKVVPHTESLLRGLGCTRFSVTGGELSPKRQLMKDIPPFLSPQLEGLFVSYLSIRGHVGWLPQLAEIPWEYLLYEGHKGEGKVTSEQYLDELRALHPALVSCEVVSSGAVQDGDSEERLLYLLRRNG